jgi:hypothetical protein
MPGLQPALDSLGIYAKLGCNPLHPLAALRRATISRTISAPNMRSSAEPFSFNGRNYSISYLFHGSRVLLAHRAHRRGFQMISEGGISHDS